MARFNKIFTKKLYMPDGTHKGQMDKMTQVTATASELNILDGVTSTAAELNIMDGVTATAAEINTVADYSAELAARLQTAEHGAGAIGTAFAPRTYRWTNIMGHIITEIHVDLTGLACKGDAAKDAIGLAAGGAAYIGRYVTATYGIVYKITMSCIELPGEGTATITADIDLGAENTSTTTYDQAVDDVVINTASLVAGETAQTIAPALTANDYIFLVEGDNAGATGEYNAGQYIITFYGHPLIT